MGELFAVVLTIITVVSTAIFVMHVWWLPADISVHGPWIDRQLLETMVSSGVLFVLSQLAFRGCRRCSSSRASPSWRIASATADPPDRRNHASSSGHEADA